MVCIGVLIPRRYEKTIYKSRETERLAQWANKIGFCAMGLYLIYSGFSNSN
jgi:hypothetical protein